MGEDVQVLPPVVPHVSASVYIIGMFQTGFGKQFVQLVAPLKEEVFVSACYPVEFYSGFFEFLGLLKG